MGMVGSPTHSATVSTPAALALPEQGQPLIPPGPHDPAPPVRFVGGEPHLEGAAVASSAPAAVIDPYDGYSAEPAPMGIADFGVGPGNVGYTISSTQDLGVFRWNDAEFTNASLGTGSTHELTVQLNVVLEFVQGGKDYAFWIQDVAVPNVKTANDLTMTYEDNIWNFSSAATSLGSGTSTLSGSGTVASDSGMNYYYDEASGSKVLDGPSQFYLLVTSAVSSKGLPVVSFEYSNGGGAFTTYDTVTFNFAKAVTQDNNFYIDGLTNPPAGDDYLYYSEELDVGGPGGGTYQIAAATTVASLNLYYWNGNNWESTPDAWNFGGDTAESVSNVQVIGEGDTSGRLETAMLNGTARDSAPGQAWTSAQVGTLNVTLPASATNMQLTVGHDSWGFNGSWAAQRLWPGTYPVWVNGTTSYSLGSCTITAGATLAVAAASGCGGSSGSPITISSYTSSPNPVDAGAKTTLTTTATGGTGALTYSYSGLPSPCTSSNTATLACTPSAAGTSTVMVTVTDTASHKAFDNLTLTVNSAIAISSFTATPSTVTLGSSTTLAVTASGGSGTFSYVYTGLPSPCKSSSAASIACVSGSAGTFSVKTWVTDADGGNTSASTSFTVTTVASGPTISSFTASPASVNVGSATTLSVTATGGTAPLSYAYTTLPTGCTTSNASTLSCTPTAAGTFTVMVTVTDAAHKAASANTTVTVTTPPPPALTLSSFSVSPVSISVGSSATFTAVVSGGVTPYSYSYTSLPAGCTTSNASTLSCTPTAAGTSTVTLTVTDAAHSTVTGTVTLTVTNPPIVVNSFVANPTNVVLGGGTTLTVTASGGVGTLSYAYTDPSGSGCGVSTHIDSDTCTPTAAGSYTITVTVTDSASQQTTGTVDFTVVLPAGPSVTSFVATPSTITVGETSDLVVETSGGYGTLSYAYTGLPAGCASIDAATLTCTPAATGTFTLTVTVTDSADRAASETATLVVNAVVPPALSTPTLAVSPSSITLGSSATFTTGVTGGDDVYTYAYSGLPSGCSAENVSTFTCTPGAVGSFTVTVTVTDPLAQSGHASVTLQVSASNGNGGTGGTGGSGGSGSSSLLSGETPWIILLLLVAVIIVIALIAASRRRSGPEGMSEWSEGPGAGPMGLLPCPQCGAGVPPGTVLCARCGAPQPPTGGGPGYPGPSPPP